MKRILLAFLAVLLVLGLLGAAGLVGYRIGFNRGIQVSAADNRPFLAPPVFGFGLGPQRMPMHDFMLRRGRGPGAYGLLDRGVGFGFFPLFGLLLRLLFWGLVILAIYMLLIHSGWRLTRTPTETAPPVVNMENRE